MLDWRPELGQVALVEFADGRDDCLTGVVVGTVDHAVVVNLGVAPVLEPCEVAVSIFSPDALYRLGATLSPRENDALVDLDIHHIERIQRREAARVKAAVPVVLSNLDGADREDDDSVALVSVLGESLDVGEGGCRVVVARRFPPGCDPTVTIHLSEATTLVALATVLEEIHLTDGRYEYRLVFTDQEDGHRKLLAGFIGAA